MEADEDEDGGDDDDVVVVMSDKFVLRLSFMNSYVANNTGLPSATADCCLAALVLAGNLFKVKFDPSSWRGGKPFLS